MEPLKNHEELLKQARDEEIDRRYALARRVQSVAFVLGLVLASALGVSAFSRGSLLLGVVAMALCIVLVASHFRSRKLTKQAFLARKMRHSLPITLVAILAVFGAIVANDLLRAGTS